RAKERPSPWLDPSGPNNARKRRGPEGPRRNWRLRCLFALGNVGVDHAQLDDLHLADVDQLVHDDDVLGGNVVHFSLDVRVQDVVQDVDLVVVQGVLHVDEVVDVDVEDVNLDLVVVDADGSDANHVDDDH